MTPQQTVQATEVGLTAVRRIVDLWATAKPASLIDYTRQLRVEPICLVDADTLYLESLPEVMQSLLAIFSGYYLQAVALSCQVGQIETRRHLDQFNPSRDAAKDLAGMGRDLLAAESYQHELPVPETHSVSLEALNDHIPVAVQQRIDARRQEMAESRNTGVTQLGKDTVRGINENSNLSVGKLLEVTIGDGGQHKAVLPVAIRLLANSLPSASLVHILSHGAEDVSMKERWHGWRSGRLQFWKDLVFCRDLIDSHKRALMKDKDGIYAAMTQRKTHGVVAGLLSGQPSIGMASNLVVMSDTTAEELERKTNYQLKSFAQRQKIFEQTAIMIMAVVDKRWERVTFYHRGIALPTEVSVRELKAANKGSGPDVSDILKAYQLGNAPSL